VGSNPTLGMMTKALERGSGAFACFNVRGEYVPHVEILSRAEVVPSSTKVPERDQPGRIDELRIQLGWSLRGPYVYESGKVGEEAVEYKRDVLVGDFGIESPASNCGRLRVASCRSFFQCVPMHMEIQPCTQHINCMRRKMHSATTTADTPDAISILPVAPRAKRRISRAPTTTGVIDTAKNMVTPTPAGTNQANSVPAIISKPTLTTTATIIHPSHAGPRFMFSRSTQPSLNVDLQCGR
jgi:hypothetical protein